MTENRHFAGWLRAQLRTIAGLAAVAGALALSGCGGGSGAPNNFFQSGMTISPSTGVAYSANPMTLTITGGTGPFAVSSSDPNVLPVAQSASGRSIVLVPNNVAADTPVTITVQDLGPLQPVAPQASAVITVRPSPLVRSLTLKADSFTDACPNPGGSSSATDDSAQTFICAGQTGSVAVRVTNPAGGGLPGRQVKFDIVQGDFRLFTNAPGQPPTYALSYTVPSDQNGDAIARVQALPNATQQVVIVQATDLLTGTFVRGIFVITNPDGLLIQPDTVTIQGPDTLHCSSGVTTTFFIYGGQPPFTIPNTFPQFLSISPTIVNAVGSGFNVTTNGGCVDPAVIGITDSLGHTTIVTLTNELGTTAPAVVTTPIPIVTSPSNIPMLTCTGLSATTQIVITGGGTSTQQGTTTTPKPPSSYFVSVNQPNVVSVSPTITVAPPAPVTLTRRIGSNNDPTGNVTLTISDGAQEIVRTVPVALSCPP